MEGNDISFTCAGKLWNASVTWYTDIPDFTPCFQHIVLVLSPNFFFSLIAVISMWHTSRCTSRPPLPWTLLSCAKLVLCFLLISISIIELSLSLYRKFVIGYVHDGIVLCTSFTKCVAFVFVLLMLLQHKASGIKSSSVLSVFWCLSSICGAIIYRSSVLSLFYDKFVLVKEEKFILDTCYFLLVLFQFLLSLFSDSGGIQVMEASPLDEEQFFSIVTFHWFNRVIFQSTKRLLTVKDFPPLTPRLRANILWRKFNSVWCKKLTNVAAANDVSKHELPAVIVKQPSVPSLALTLMTAFWPWIVLSSVLELCFDIMRFFSPLVLSLLIDFTSSDEYAWRGYFYCLLMFVSFLVSACVSNMVMFYLSTLSLQFKSALLCAIYRKALKLSSHTRRQYTTGEMVNLMAVDVDKVFNFSLFGTLVFGAPLRILLTIVFLWQYLGPSCLAGFAVILVVVPLSTLVGRVNHSVQVKQMQTKDLRLKHMNEILNGIKVLKLCAWEVPFMKNVEQIRNKEVKLIRTFQFCYAVFSFIWSCSPFFVAIACFVTYVMISEDNVLDPSTAFVSLSLINMMRFSLFQIPDLLSSFVQTNISLKRLRSFLMSEERCKTAIGNTPDKGQAVSIKEASFSWEIAEEPTLKNINLVIPQGSLVAIIGQVGSGKSSLLSSMLGDMQKLSGSVDLKGKIAYVPQQAWILNQTLKQNIIFTKPMDTEKYQKVLSNCCLKPDLEILPGGDMTEIGERGMNLSGGQKQRVSLARAVFQNADIYLLDDPLSAVDSHVGKDLFDHVIGPKGMLNRKTRILVTHNISVLPEVDFIVSMKNGTICETGTYKDLINKKEAFAEFIKDHKQMPAEIEEHVDDIASLMDHGISDKSPSDLSPFVLRATSVESLCKTSGAQLMEDERMEVGKVKRKVYVNYLQHASFLLVVLTVLGYVSNEGLEIGASVWLSKWSSDEPLPDGTQNVPLRNTRIGVYAALGTAQAFAMMFGTIMLTLGAAKASKLYHQGMLQSVMKSPMSFFDTTPLGRILNRFGKDIDVVDTEIPVDFDGWIYCLLAVLGTCVVIGMSTPLFLAALIPISIIYYFIQKLYLISSRQIKRLESTTRSPIYSHFSETVQGVSSIRAYNVGKEFITRFESKVDTNVSCYFHWVCSNRWLAFRLDAVGNFVVLTASILAVANRGIIDGAIVGLSLSYALSLTDSLTWMVRTWTELENKLVSVERIDEYSMLPSEAPWIVEGKRPPELWPTKGTVSFKDYSTRYRENLDLVLNNIRLDIASNEKIGIVGRTGAGKSSITLSLFRIIEAVTGQVTIDEIDISGIGLHDLRSKLTIIPQDPVLFTGTLRVNLDPNGDYSDEDLWTSLEHAHLKSFISSLSDGLDYTIAEGGENLSVGQRQLICLARALLKNTKILVLDEATAAVDMETDSLIQKTIREEFEEYTVITIAHRLHTIMDYDRVVVMDAGRIIETGKPSDLLQDKDTKFFSMAKDAGLV